MSDGYNNNISKAAYRAALIVERDTPGIDKERKAAVVAELDALGAATADENRFQVETAAGGPTVGRAPAASPTSAPKRVSGDPIVVEGTPGGN